MLGKFFSAATFGVFSALAPVIVLCSVASFTSPNWSFLTEQYDVILSSVGFCCLQISVITLLVLCVSSLVERKTLALVGVFGFLFLFEATGNLLFKLTSEPLFQIMRLQFNLNRIANWMLDRPRQFEVPVDASFLAVGGLALTCILVLARRVRRMEVVA